MQGSFRRTLGALATVAVLFSSNGAAQIGPFPKWGLTRVDSWAAGSSLTVGDVELATTAISLTFSFDATVGATLASVGHRSVRPDGTVTRWDYPASPPLGQASGFWKAVLRPLDSNDPFEVTPDSATGFDLWVDSTTGPQRALFCWSGLTIPGRNPEHRFTMEVELSISPATPARAEWQSRMIRVASSGNEPFTIDEVHVPIVYSQQPAAQAGLARLLVPVSTVTAVPAPNLSMALWQALGIATELDHPARGQNMQFSALYSCDSSIQIPIGGGELLSPFGKILYLTTEDTDGHFKRFAHSVVPDPTNGLLSYRWAPIYYPAYGFSKRVNVFSSRYPAVMCAFHAQNDSFWFDVTSHYREFVRDEMDLDPMRDSSCSLNPDFIGDSVFVPTTNLPAFLPDLDDVFGSYVDAAIDMKAAFVDPVSGAPSPVFLEWQKWLNGDASVGEDPYGSNPVPFTGIDGAFREPSEAARDEVARAYANGINVSVYTRPLTVDTSTWTSFSPLWLLYDRLGNTITSGFEEFVDLGSLFVPFWFSFQFYDDILDSSPGLGGFFLDTLGGQGSFLRFPPPGQTPFGGFRYNGGTAYVRGGQRLFDSLRQRLDWELPGNQHPNIPFVLTEAVQEFYAGRYDFAQHGLKPLPGHTQLSTLLDQISGVFVPAPVGSSIPNPPLWNAVYHEFSRAEALGMMLSTRGVSAFLGGGQDFDPANPAAIGLSWDQWCNYTCMIHGLLFQQGMKSSIFPYFYDAKDFNLLVRDGVGGVDVRDPSVPQQSQVLDFVQRLHQASANLAEAGQFVQYGVAERPLELPALPITGYSPAVMSTRVNPSLDAAQLTDNVPALTRSFYEDPLTTLPFAVATVFHSVWRADPDSDTLGLVFVNWSDAPANWSGTFVPSLYEGLGDDFVVKGIRPLAGGAVGTYVIGSGSGTTELTWNATAPAGAIQLEHHAAGAAGAMPPGSVQVILIEPQ